MINKKSVITLQGMPGSGKSDTVKYLKEYFPDYTHVSVGALARKIAEEYNIPFNDFPEYARENNIAYDKILDERLKEAGSHDDVIIDSRLGYFFAQESFKVFLIVDPSIAAKRVFDDPNRPDSSAKQHSSFETLIEQMKERHESDRQKYIDLYGTDYTDLKNYNLVIDTGLPENDQHAVAKQISEAYKNWLES